MIMPTEIRLKHKYVVGQTAGRNKGGHNDSTRRRPMRHKGKGKPQPQAPSTAYLILLPSGKIRMVKDG
jgi:hypothetical protein